MRTLQVFGGELIAGGDFYITGGFNTYGIARWNGAEWQPLGEGMDEDSAFVGALTVCERELIVGGDFTIAGGVSARRIARWNGLRWAPLGSGLGGDYVMAMAVFDGVLNVGGYFSTAGGHVSTNWARWGLPGDLACDGVVNGDDIEAFVTALLDPTGYAAAYECDLQLADMNLDRQIDIADAQPFVEALLAQ